MPHHFRISVQSLDAGEPVGTPLAFDVANHDDILEIVDKVRLRAPVPADEVAPFAVGLKLFTEVLIRHRADPLFEPLWPHVGAFMKRLKALPQGNGEDKGQ
ncbi:MAG: DUF3861 domain-containing protein [Novosphingobium sp.]